MSGQTRQQQADAESAPHVADSSSLRQVSMTHLVHNSVLSSKQLVHREARQLGQRSPKLWQKVSPAVAGLGQQAEAGDPAISGAVHSAYGQRLAVCCYPAGLALQVALEHWLQPSVQLWRDAHAALSGVYVTCLAFSSGFETGHANADWFCDGRLSFTFFSPDRQANLLP